jgi:hypothetical protein
MTIELQPKQYELSVPFPVDYAVVAMSYLHLGQLDKAEEYRVKLDEPMNSLTFMNIAVCESFRVELSSAMETYRQSR